MKRTWEKSEFYMWTNEAGTEGVVGLVNGKLDGTGRLVYMLFKSRD
jgi:hypothetical protein